MFLRTALGLSILFASLPAQNDRGLRGGLAPPWQLTTWFNLPARKKTAELSDFRGKVVYVYCFQSWCPGCHSHGFPLLQKLTKAYAKTEDVAFVAVQTVFEGHEANTLDRAKRIARRYELAIPFAHDTGPDGKYSSLMRSYRTGGTPWTILIDKNGIVRYDGFSSRLTTVRAKKMIDELRQDRPLVGQQLGAERSKLPYDFSEHELTLVTWFSDSAASVISMPALVDLHDRLEMSGLGMLAIGADSDAGQKLARRLGHEGTVHVDRGATLLDNLRRRGMPQRSSEPKFLVDKTGRIVWVHPGPRLHGSDAPQDWGANREMKELEAVVSRRLSKQKKAPAKPKR